MTIFQAGRYQARLAQDDGDIRRCQQLRYLTFIAERGLGQAGAEAVDADRFDSDCRHMMVEEAATGALVACFRLLPLADGSEIGRSYSAQHYNLARLAAYPSPMVEMGRFCIHPAWRDPNILRAAWGAVSRFVDAHGVGLIFGCSSFQGQDADAYRDAFALLAEKHIAPPRWLPRPKAPNVFRFARLFRFIRPDVKLALRRMPPLLRSYLGMGGWVSDHAVIDPELNTLHVFTGVEVGRVPTIRARLLRRQG